MRIKSLYCKNHFFEWEIKEIDFSNANTTLLVGISGVGKTQILKAIANLQYIVDGASINGFEWNVKFSIGAKNYFWEGIFDTLTSVEGLRRVVLYENVNLGSHFIYKSIDSISMQNQFRNLEDLMNLKGGILFKLAVCFFHFKNTFKEIIVDFKEVFPQVEDVRFVLKSFGEEGEQNAYFFQLKEKGVDKWIDKHSISAGMWKTLLHIADLYLAPENGILLIDEFENSLGVNCIDVLAENLMFGRDEVQVILTSHHPYIINKIPLEYWKVVTRKGGVIQTYASKELNLERSHHEHFLSLLNLPEYKTGIPSSAL